MKTMLRPGLQSQIDAARARADKTEPVPRSLAEKLGPLLAVLAVLVWLAGIPLGFSTSVTILTAVGFILVALGLFSPTLGLLGVGMLSTLDAVTRNFILTGGLLRWNTFNYWLLIVIVLNLAFLLRLNNLHVRLLELFTALLMVELVISTSPSTGVQDLLNIIAAFGLITYLARGFQIKGGLYWMAVVSGVISGLGGMVYFQQITSLPYVNPNSWAFFPLTGLFAICLGYPSSKEHRLGNPLLLVLASVNFLWIFLSGSRGSMLVGVLCLLFLFLWTRKMTWKLAFLGAAWLALGVISLVFADQQAYASSRIERLLNPSLSMAQRTSGRVEIAQGGLQIFLDNPLGVGTGSFRDTIADSSYSSNQVAAHSGWVKSWRRTASPASSCCWHWCCRSCGSGCVNTTATCSCWGCW